MSKAEKTREYIVEKTAPIFNMKGYAGTSLTDMTEATGLTKGSIYGNFANKDEVALAAFDHNLKKVSSIIKQEMDKHASIKDKMLVYVNVYENYLKFPFPVGGCPILNTAIDADDTHTGLKQKACDAISGWKNMLVKLVDKGIELKEINKAVNSEQAALTLIAMMEGAIMISKVTGKAQYRKAIMQSIADMIREL